jgi:hypothetical protein
VTALQAGTTTVTAGFGFLSLAVVDTYVGIADLRAYLLTGASVGRVPNHSADHNRRHKCHRDAHAGPGGRGLLGHRVCIRGLRRRQLRGRVCVARARADHQPRVRHQPVRHSARIIVHSDGARQRQLPLQHLCAAGYAERLLSVQRVGVGVVALCQSRCPPPCQPPCCAV